MRYAITMEHHMIFQHFGKCPQFLLIDIHDNEITKRQILTSGSSGHGALTNLLADANVDVVICGGIGSGARSALLQKHISVYAGQSGNVDTVIEAIKKGLIEDKASGHCDHHHEGEEHDCAGTQHTCH